MAKFTVRKILLLVCLWTGIFCNYVCYSICAPFYPQLARKKGLSAEQFCLVFGSFSLSQIIFSLIIGKSLAKIGAKFVVVWGLFTTGGAIILFGCMENSRGGNVFFVLCLVIRFVEGAGIAAYLTSVLVIIVKTFPTDPGYYVGLTESVITIAMIAGPPIGSFLYTIGGFITPFVTFGVIIIVNCIACVYLVPVERNSISLQTEYDPLTIDEYRHLLSLPASILAIVCVTTNVTANAFVLITLSDHLTQLKSMLHHPQHQSSEHQLYISAIEHWCSEDWHLRMEAECFRISWINDNPRLSLYFLAYVIAFVRLLGLLNIYKFSLNAMGVGLVYLCLFLSYGFSSPASGYIADRTSLEFFLQALGSIIVSLAFLLIGPAVFFHMKAKLWMIVAGLLLRGVGAGPLISCAFTVSLRAARKCDMPDDFRTYSLVSSLISFSIPFGNLIGSILAGFMYENLGMAISTTIYFGIFLLLAVVCFIGHLNEYPLKFLKSATERSHLFENDIKMESLPCDNIFNIIVNDRTEKTEKHKDFKKEVNFGFIYNLAFATED